MMVVITRDNKRRWGRWRSSDYFGGRRGDGIMDFEVGLAREIVKITNKKLTIDFFPIAAL